MNTKVWYLSFFEGVYHPQMIQTFVNANARMVRMVHTMIETFSNATARLVHTMMLNMNQ